MKQAIAIFSRKARTNTKDPAKVRVYPQAGLRRGFDAQESSLFRTAMQLALSLNVSYIIMENVNDICSASMRHVWLEALGALSTC